MILGTGVDIIEVDRIARALERFPDAFLHRVFTASEIADCWPGELQRVRRLAARFAAKEATLKALGIGLRQVKWTDMTVVNDSLGKPNMLLGGRLAEIAQELGVRTLHLSMSHCKAYALAQVVVVQ
jgi:holo-[acyl-carrier protein] synthase